MKMSLGKKILIGFTICGLILIGMVTFTFNNSEKYQQSNALVDHTNQVLFELQQIQRFSIDAETGARGFVISGKDNFLEPFDAAKNEVINHITIAKNLTNKNPSQLEKVEAAEKEINTHIDYLDKLIGIAKNDPERAKAIVSSGEGKRIMDKIRRIISGASQDAKDLLETRKKESERDSENFNLVFAILLIIILIVLVFVYFIIITNLRALRKAEEQTSNKNWLLTGNSALNEKMQGEKDLKELTADIITQIATYTGAQLGAIYTTDENKLILNGSYAFDFKHKDNILKFGQGLAGQAAVEMRPIIFSNIPEDYFKISSTFGNILPKQIIVFPVMFAGKLKGIIELASVKEFSGLSMDFLNMVSENIGIAINSSQSRMRLKELLEETQMQSEELQSQQEELRQVNEELEEQTQNLKQQQEELQITNEELEEQTRTLEIKNREVELARTDIEQKTKQLEISSRYKSEFLANMSHELRTPLNSLLILSKELADNRTENLNEEQVESAEIIYKSGQDLLVLINEVLDLSKIEAGKMDITIEKVILRNFANNIQREFKRQIEKKGLKFNLDIDPELPEYISTDSQRLNQIVKNILSNAIKFTEKGSIEINLSKYTDKYLSIEIKDTGIGIPTDKQNAIFEAFQQADGGTSRKYGGTGLGLSISRELAKLLGAEIHLNSKPNEGSSFSIIIPFEKTDLTAIPKKEVQEERLLARRPVKNNIFINYPSIKDDRDHVDKDNKVVLIIEDDLKFAEILAKQASKKGFKYLAASTGEDGLVLCEKFRPDAVILDIDLPGINGHQVLNELKSNPALRHIPVHIMSVNERTLEPIKEGAIEYLMKPVEKTELEEAFNRIENFVSRKMRNLLIIEDDEFSRKAMRKLIGNGDVKCYEAASGEEAIRMYKDLHFDCIVLDIGLPDMTGFELIYELEKVKGTVPPIIIYTGKELTKEESQELQKYAESIIIKGVKSEERLLDETALFLHRAIGNLPESKQSMIQSLYDKEAIFNNKKILLVDDDMRNVFALSKILRDRGMDVIKAENGLNALEMLAKHTNIDLVLMDIMMPEMDGYEAMERIRAQDKYRKLPIIALTAKAMKDDKQKCIDAGANEYITKPVDIERLLSLMRVWLSK